VAIKVINLLNQNAWIWSKGKFMNRYFLILDHYQKYLEGEEDILYMRKDDDPFWEPVDCLYVGMANVFLQSLVYLMDFSDTLTVYDFKVGFSLSRFLC
jgi:kinesin family protein 1